MRIVSVLLFVSFLVGQNCKLLASSPKPLEEGSMALHSPLVWESFPLLTSTVQDLGKGVSALYTGIHANALLVAGGCNFPNIPVAEGGEKVFYDEIFVMPEGISKTCNWMLSARLPQPMAYGATYSTSKGIVLVGGCNNSGSLSCAYRLCWNPKSQQVTIHTLPDLPVAAFNIGGASMGNRIYVAGGVVEGKASNRFFVLDLAALHKGWCELPSFPGAARAQPVMAILSVQGRERVYLWSGFAPSSEGVDVSVSTDGLYFDLRTQRWHEAGAIADGSSSTPLSLGGGVGVAVSAHQMLCLGGVESELFHSALVRDKDISEAVKAGRQQVVDSLKMLSKVYLLQPPSWYQFNSRALLFDARDGTWKSLGIFPQTALAGASLNIYRKQLYLYNGELKPGIRTPLNWKGILKLSKSKE